jgi:hypothetical protein
VERVAPIVGLASQLGRGVQRIATDAIVGRVRSLPRTIGDLDATALSQIMGRTVTSVAVIAGDAGTSSRARLALTGDDVPESVFDPLTGRFVLVLEDLAVDPYEFPDILHPLDNYRAVARLIDAPPNTVMHGDAHPGNVYFRNGAAGLLDWQAVRRGHPGRELAYTLVTSMTTADRRASERELLDEYRVLASAGGPDLDTVSLLEKSL